MVNFLLFLLISLFVMVFLECYVKDKYFKDDIRKHYFRILKSILNILVIMFMFHYRTYMLSLNQLGIMLIIACIIALIINIAEINKTIQFLKKENAL
ncbi:hypothetical protein CLLI_17410 [Clostridium liquoris]|jgi:hypothetical protein|uniref:Uncharacterized protein n=1 Tax=Clostridium liquoris TaxID=1289519 RepID=A0A2T0B337_9CLOT|nr:hypothetical protein [Clostridium liquoris]PRR78314.1 hypothetical protein CLLI_17410 [Clostridium liquoris]